MRYICLALAFVALVGAGCGGSSKPNATTSSSPALGTTGASLTSSSNTVDASASDSEATTGTDSEASEGGDASSSDEVPATAALARPCVRAGVPADAQTLTVSGAAADEVVGYSTEYSDQSNELTNPSYTTGFGYGQAGADGVYRATWVVPANAPPGTAIVHLVSGGPIQESVSFQVVASSGTCP